MGQEQEYRAIYFFHPESLPKKLKLTLFRCFAVSLSLSSSWAPLLRTSILGHLLFPVCFYSHEKFTETLEKQTACKAKDHY